MNLDPSASSSPSLTSHGFNIEGALPGGAEQYILNLYSQVAEPFASEGEMTEWLASKGVDCDVANSRKGLTKLFEKIEAGEAKLIYDSQSNRVFRCARVARIDAEITIAGETFPLVELCQIFLKDKISKSVLESSDCSDVGDLLSKIEIRSAQVRNSQQLWETLIGEEDAELGARRGVKEELGLTTAVADQVEISMTSRLVEYEDPIDWPGIHSILETNSAKAVLPESISRPVFWELEAGDQITIFVATPNAPVIKGLLGAVIPNIQYVA